MDTRRSARPDARRTHDYLKALGASEIITRESIAKPSGKPLDSEAWAGVIDSVGGTTLATVLPQLMAHGSVASCGLAGGAKLETTVIPFLLRGVNILGIDSVMCPIDAAAPPGRSSPRIAGGQADSTIQTATLETIAGLAPEILAGKVRGRVVVEI